MYVSIVSVMKMVVSPHAALNETISVIERAVAGLPAVDHLALESVAVRPSLGAIARPSVAVPVAVVDVSVARAKHAASVPIAGQYLSNVHVAVLVVELAVAVHAVAAPIAVVLASVVGAQGLSVVCNDVEQVCVAAVAIGPAVGEYESAAAVLLVVEPLTVVALAALEHQISPAALETVAEVALVAIAALELEHAVAVEAVSGPLARVARALVPVELALAAALIAVELALVAVAVRVDENARARLLVVRPRSHIHLATRAALCALAVASTIQKLAHIFVAVLRYKSAFFVFSCAVNKLKSNMGKSEV